MDLPAILARADVGLVVIHTLMLQASVRIDAAAVRVQDGAGQHVCFQNVLNGKLGGDLDALRADFTAALDQRHNLLLVTHTAPSSRNPRNADFLSAYFPELRAIFPEEWSFSGLWFAGR